MKDIIVKFIPQSEQRFASLGSSTCIGDYWETDKEIHFRITELPNPTFSLAILIHELAEKFQNDRDGVLDSDVDSFDMNHPELEDAGMSPNAPYHKGHCIGDVLERSVIALAGESWATYEQAVSELFTPKE